MQRWVQQLVHHKKLVMRLIHKSNYIETIKTVKALP
jgi:hypothetical protein